MVFDSLHTDGVNKDLNGLLLMTEIVNCKQFFCKGL